MKKQVNLIDRQAGQSRWTLRAGPVIVLGLAFVLTGCGTTSGLRKTSSTMDVNFQKYHEVAVMDFADKTKDQKLGSHGKHFADLIAAEVLQTKAFGEVSRPEEKPAGALLVTGEITRCKEGSAAARLWIGLGAGSSYFDATVRFIDVDTGQELGTMLVDKNSWPLGGGLAAGQTVETFMQGASRKVAEQLTQPRDSVAQLK